MKKIRCLVIAISTLAVLPALGAETYIVPIWGTSVRGAAGMYGSVISFTNTGDESVTVRVTDVVPIQYSSEPNPCSLLACGDSEWVVRPHSTQTSESGIIFKNKILELGGLILEASAPLHVESDIYLRATHLVDQWQSVQIATGWLTGGSIIPRAIPTQGAGTDHFKLYLLNPNDYPIRIDYSARPYGLGSANVSAHAIQIVELPISFACPAGCAVIEPPTGSGRDIELQSDFPYLAASTLSSMALPPAVRVALPNK